MPKIKIEHACDSCNSTGLYTGFAEGKGAAVICNGCGGTGKAVFEMTYQKFTGRKGKNGIVRVLRTNPGIGIGEIEGRKLEDFGGLSYKDWKAGKPFGPGTEMRNFTCPAWWYNVVDYKKQPDWDECLENGTQIFSRCPHFDAKAACWERFDKERKGKK